MTEQYAWVDELEMFSLLLARDADPVDLLAVLGDGLAETSVMGVWPGDDRVQVAMGRQNGWTYALGFSSGMLPEAPVDAVGARWDTVTMWFDIHANSDLRVYRGGSLVRRCEVIGYDFGPTTGDALPEEAGLFVQNDLWDQRGDGLEVVARLTGTEPVMGWWDEAESTWSLPLRF